ncbi:uncharacterized protein LOC143377049 [Andrena cerasifolii]|uniref:uncharacterized protein LOC143377049 n=1 Tax=Andrena cerasifolii TaxID=2819439 RepID=UPI004037DDE4
MVGDGIPNEAWKFGGEKGAEAAWEICRRVWEGEGWPQGWKEGLIAPLVKKGRGTGVQDYRGVTLMPTLYKVYAAVLGERLEQEVEGKGMIPENQAGFRRGRGTVDQIYVLNHMIGKQTRRGKGKLAALFVDLKAAFDTVDRSKLWEAMEKRGEFCTSKGLRQGCPLSPILFNLLIADVEEEINKGTWGGVRIGGRRICSLAYADDLVLLAGKEEEMESMIRRLERYLEGKNLEVNVAKTKVVRFRKGGGRDRKVEWKWKGREIEEGEKGRGRNETGLGNWKKEVWKGLGKEDVAVRCAGVDGFGVRGGGMGVEGEGGGREGTGKVHKVVVGGRLEDARIYGEGGDKEGKAEDVGGGKGVEVVISTTEYYNSSVKLLPGYHNSYFTRRRGVIPATMFIDRHFVGVDNNFEVRVRDKINLEEFVIILIRRKQTIGPMVYLSLYLKSRHKATIDKLCTHK